MKKIVLLSVILIIVNFAPAQPKALKITRPNSNKELIIKENRRIKISTTNGQKLAGRFHIVDQIIVIKNQRISLSDIETVKRHPILLSILSSGLFIYAGAILTGFGVLIGVLADSSAFLLTIPGAAMLFTGIKSPNFSRKYKNSRGWQFEIITIGD